MKYIKQYLVILLALLAYWGKAQDQIVYNNSVYTGTSEVVATQQVILENGFHAVSGSNVRVYIGSHPTTNYTTPTISVINSFNSSGNTGRNYIHTTTLLENAADATSLYDEFRIEKIDYFDGLGRPIQTVTVQGSPDRQDIVQPFEYDDYGREVKKYLPYFGSNNNGNFVTGAISDCEDYYDTNKGWRDQDTYPYDYTHFESSPLNRVLGVTGSGSNWQGHPTEINYFTNNSPVEGWTVNGNSLTTGFSYNTSMYPANQLYITEFIDEDGVKTREYKDKIGQVVRKETYNINGWQRTAYIYDDFGLLRCVVPPLATTTNQPGLCYYYLYDNRKRMVEKQLPGAGKVSMVYDARDRLVMTKDAENEWMATIYDNLNRPVMSCIIPSASGASRGTLQSVFDEFVGNAVCSNTGDHFGYTTTNIFPTGYTFSESNVQTVTFYDNYAFLGAPDFSANSNDYSYTGAYLASDPASGRSTKTKGLVTATLTRVIDNAITNSDNLLLSVSYFDDYGRSIRVISDNHLGGKDKVYTDYDFVGKPELVVTTHNIDGAGEDVKLTSTYTYDHQGRLLTEKLKLNNDDEITLTANEYGELGELAAKYLHGTASAQKFNQKIDYKYNIKGWLTNINEVNDPDNNLFALALQYADGTNGNYNGNIWKMDWQTNGGNPKRYTFNYDSGNRIHTAAYADGNGFNSNINDYYTHYTYDKNGNLDNLQRYSNGNLIDDLDYYYITNSNKLESVDDLAPTAYKNQGYKEGANNYAYDNNGNMTEDHNGVDINYNYLNLPQNAVYNAYNTINFDYSASGVKLRKTVTSQTIGNKIVDYIGPFLYEDEDLKVIFTSAGRIVKRVDGNNVLWKYEYNLTDHLGNVHAVFAAHENGIPELMQQTDFYPFGLVMEQQETFALEEVKNRYLYNGKELQDDNIGIQLGWYDYGARFYDPQLARWHSVDPLADEEPGWSPYRYGFNNPIKFIDPNGMLEDWFENELTGDVYYNSSMTKGDEGTGAMEGEGWKHMGENGMFSEGKVGSSDISVIAQNEQLVSEASIDFEGNTLKAEASFEGENAVTFMSNQDYKKVTKQATQDIETNTAKGAVGTRGEVTVTLTRVTRESVEKVGYVPNSFEQLGAYRLNTIKPGQPIIGVGISSETVQYRFEYGQKSRGLKILDVLIKINNINSGNINISR